jgi:hypothetical protein
MGAKRTDAPDLDPLVSVETSRTASGQRPDVDDEAASLRRALEEEKQRNLRLRADFDNLRKRSWPASSPRIACCSPRSPRRARRPSKPGAGHSTRACTTRSRTSRRRGTSRGRSWRLPRPKLVE